MKPKLTLIPEFSLHPGQLNLYNAPHWEPARPNRENVITHESIQERTHEHLLSSTRTAEGKVSKIAKRKILKALNYMLLLTNNKTIHNQFTGKNFKFKIAFVTLTLPSRQIHSDNEIKAKCLNQFIIEIKRVYKVKRYIWRAEKQKNGNIHFHIIVDKFIPYLELRSRWNRIVNKLGYVDRYREDQMNWHSKGFKPRLELRKTWSIRKQKEAYERGVKGHWNNPNSTDVHSVYKIRNIKEYISKYLTKNEIDQKINENEEIDLMQQTGRIWSCSEDLMNLKGAKGTIDNEIEFEIEDLKKCDGVKIIDDPYFTIIFFDLDILINSPNSRLFALFSEYLIDKFQFNLQSQFAA